MKLSKFNCERRSIDKERSIQILLSQNSRIGYTYNCTNQSLHSTHIWKEPACHIHNARIRKGPDGIEAHDVITPNLCSLSHGKCVLITNVIRTAWNASEEQAFIKVQTHNSVIAHCHAQKQISRPD